MQKKKKMKPRIYIVIRHSLLFWYANIAFIIFAPYLLLYFCDKVFARSKFVQIHFFATLKATTSLILGKMLFVFCIFLIFIRQHNRYFNSKRSYLCYYNVVGEAEQKILIFSKKAVKLPRTCTIYLF